VSRRMVFFSFFVRQERGILRDRVLQGPRRGTSKGKGIERCRKTEGLIVAGELSLEGGQNKIDWGGKILAKWRVSKEGVKMDAEDDL